MTQSNSNSNSKKFNLLLIILFSVLSINSLASCKDKEMVKYPLIKSIDTAFTFEQKSLINLSYQFFGIDSTTDNISIQMLSVEDTTTLSGIEHKSIWMVSLKNIPHDIRNNSIETNNNNNLRDVLIYIDSTNEVPLLIISYNNVIPDVNSIESFKVELDEYLDDKNIALPKYPPTISFTTAMSKTKLLDIKAEKIIAKYFIKNFKNRGKIPVWLIIYKVDLNNEEGHSYPTNMKHITSVTSIINAETGELISENWD